MFSLSPLFHEHQDLIEAVVSFFFVAFFVSAHRATMHYFPYCSFLLDTNRYHESATFSRPITRKDIHMLAPETVGTMIGKPVASDSLMAMLTSEVFFPALKTFLLGLNIGHTVQFG